MEDINLEEDNKNKKPEKSLKKSILVYDEDSKQTLFRFFGIELTAPKGLKNPRLVYLSFILINVILLLLLKKITFN
jgi:hypothetical protein